MNKNILITGIDGFIGSKLKNYFNNQGFCVFGTTYFEDPKNEKEIQFNILNKEDFSKLWIDKDFDVIIHTIGLVDQNQPYKSMHAINSRGTKDMCEYAKAISCKHFIFTSSVSIYGSKVIGENRIEHETKRKTKRFGTPYGKSKAIAEEFIENSGLDYTNLRLPIVLGRGDTFITPSIVPRILNSTIFTCGKSNRRISVLYVKNLGPLIEKLIEIGPLNSSLNCISDTVYWEDFVKEFAKNLDLEYKPKKISKLSIFTNKNDRSYQFIASYSAFGAHYSSDKLKKILDNWQPPYKWQEGVKEAVKNFIKKQIDF
ncbi:MAG: NAD(P)-dependent oxidoreductase [Promethearchaeota archaeon]|nr:MAG: NAD(P)-dependent oxidoreductase [Candidatus Lokiarchaeota archaeon]